MFLAVGLGPAGYALGIVHLLTHGFFKAGLFLGAGSVMHAMNDERRHAPLRRPRPRHADHVRHVRAGLPRADRLPVPVRATSPRTRSSRRRSARRAGRAGCSALLATLAAGLTAFYMTRLMFMTFFGEKRWKNLDVRRTAQAYHPHESPAVMTVPMVCWRSARSSRASSSLSGHRLANWLTPSLGELVEREGPLPAARDAPWLVLVVSAIGVLDRVARGRAAAAYRWSGRAHVSWPVQAARRDLYAQRDQRGAHRHARHLVDALPRLRRQPRRRRAGQRHGRARWAAARADCAGCRPASSARTR